MNDLAALLSRIRENGKPLAVLAGAGVSLSSPSNLLDGRTFMRWLFSHAKPRSVRAGTLMRLLDPPRRPLHRPGEFLRFEVAMQCLIDSGLDPALTVLDFLDASEAPNRLHFWLASIVRTNGIVLTTNFDRLIETAYRTCYAERPAVAAYDSDFDHAPQTIWKLHGSISIDGRDTRDSVKASLHSILRRSRGLQMRRFVADVLATHNLFVVGYSGLDDLDVIPILSSIDPGEACLVWLNHSHGEEVPKITSAGDLAKRSTARSETDAVGPDRLWLHWAQAECWRVDCDTPVATAAITAAWRLEQTPYCPREPFAFGSRFPRQTRQYFRDWSQNLAGGRRARAKFVSLLMSNGWRRGSRFLQRRTARMAMAKWLDRSAEEQLAQIERNIDRIDWSEGEKQAGKREILGQIVASKADIEGRHRGMVLRIVGKLDCAMADYFFQTGFQAGLDKIADAAKLMRETGEAEDELETWLLLAEYESGWRRVDTGRLFELLSEMGHLPRFWRSGLDALLEALTAEESAPVAYDTVFEALRYAVDVGDVAGEAKARFIAGMLLFRREELDGALEQFVRASELNRLVKSRPLHSKLVRWMHACHGSDTVITALSVSEPRSTATLRAELRPAIWNGYTRGKPYAPATYSDYPFDLGL